MDPLSDMIALLRPRAAVSKPMSGKGRWAVHYGAHPAPGFTIILSGEAWLTFKGKEPMHLVEGDFLLLPSTPAFSLATPRDEAVRHGDPDGVPDFVALGGTFAFERANRSPPAVASTRANPYPGI
jgi:hypothetical protein